MNGPSIPLLFTACLALSCSEAETEASQSLVGARELPPAEALSRETIYITRNAGIEGVHRLSYEWSPDDRITISHTFRNRVGDIVEKGSETLRVSPEKAAKIRKMLWRLRPQTFEGVEQDKRPVRCQRHSSHDWGEMGVAFIAEGARPGGKKDEIGIFVLPSQESCNTPAAVEARKVAAEALSLLPVSKVASAFERELEAWLAAG
jgi:hypothetical protein